MQVVKDTVVELFVDSPLDAITDQLLLLVAFWPITLNEFCPVVAFPKTATRFPPTYLILLSNQVNTQKCFEKIIKLTLGKCCFVEHYRLFQMNFHSKKL